MNTKQAKEVDHARDQAKAQLEGITEMVARLKAHPDSRESEQAQQEIQEDALDVQVRDDWRAPGQENEFGPDEFFILLCTGGPACRIIGTLSDHAEPDSARIEYQDWGTPWTDYRLTAEEEETVLTYARCFYFGE